MSLWLHPDKNEGKEKERAEESFKMLVDKARRLFNNNTKNKYTISEEYNAFRRN